MSNRCQLRTTIFYVRSKWCGQTTLPLVRFPSGLEEHSIHFIMRPDAQEESASLACMQHPSLQFGRNITSGYFNFGRYKFILWLDGSNGLRQNITHHSGQWDIMCMTSSPYRPQNFLSDDASSCGHGAYVMVTALPGKYNSSYHVTVKTINPMKISIHSYKESDSGFWDNNDDDNDEDDDVNNYEKSHNIYMADQKTAIRFQENKENIVRRIKSALKNFYKRQ
ncbi:hypothetical protein FSP39_014924 [Pinctada imbricata]|uniref:Uncharacterized protein n=1 Tax=Pinctada imbricata TaxID=66713 RepID=A0AA88Y8G7_PINIB|nr:hypothetical protein FSP39_014924 [Pinctada imbricata]